MRALSIFVLAALLSFSATGARAESDVQKRARELVTLVVPRGAYDLMIQQMMTQMIGALRGQGQNIPADAEPKMKAAVMEVLPYDELLSWTAEIYAKHFTGKEVGDLIAFYKTPTGRKAARLLPELMGEVGTKTGQVIGQRLPAALKKQGLAP